MTPISLPKSHDVIREGWVRAKVPHHQANLPSFSNAKMHWWESTCLDSNPCRSVWEVTEEERGEIRSRRGFYMAEANLPRSPQWKGEWRQVVALSWGSQGVSMWLPLLLDTDFKEFTFSPGQRPSDLGHFWKVFSVWRDEYDHLEKHSLPQSWEFGLDKRT